MISRLLVPSEQRSICRHRFTHPRRPHRLTPSPQPLRMALARVRPRPSAARGVLRRLRACGGAGIAGGSPDDLPPAGGAVSLTLAPFLLLLFPTGRLQWRRWRFLAWIAAMSGAVLLSLNLFFDRPDEVGGPITAATVVTVLVLFHHRPLGALARGPLSSGERGGAPTAEVVRVGRRPEWCLRRRRTAKP
jgi:hypothetical protein